MKFYRHGIEYTVLNGTEVEKHIVFGWDMPETENDFNDMCEDAGAWESAEPGHKMTL